MSILFLNKQNQYLKHLNNADKAELLHCCWHYKTLVNLAVTKFMATYDVGDQEKLELVKF